MGQQLQVKSEQDFSFVCPSNEFRRVIEALQPVNDVLTVQIFATGMRLGGMDPSHVMMAVADLESSFFQEWESKTSKMTVALQTEPLLKFWPEDLLKFWPEDLHVSPIRFKMSSEKTVITVGSAGLIKTFEIAVTTEPDDLPLLDEKKYVPTTEIGVRASVWCDAVSTILKRRTTGLVLKAFEPDCVPKLLAGSCLLPFHGEIQNESVAHYSADSIVPILEPLTKLADPVLLAFGSDMPLRITARIHHGVCRFWFSPRIYGDSTAT